MKIIIGIAILLVVIIYPCFAISQRADWYNDYCERKRTPKRRSRGKMIDDILLQEIFSLREQIKILTKIVKYYEPDLNEGDFIHDLSTCDFYTYMEEIKREEG